MNALRKHLGKLLVAAALLAAAPSAHAMLGFRAMAMGKGQRTVSAFGDGADGALNVSVANTVVNTVASYLTADAAVGATQLTVNASTGFNTGDEILILQVQGASGVGNVEFRRLAGVSGTTLRFDTALVNAFTTGVFDAANAKVTQVVRVPRYTNVTLAANSSIVPSAWNGRTGGVVALRATGTITFNTGSAINADGLGFRGPPRETGVRARNGRVGEGILGNSRTICVNSSTVPDTATGGCGAVEGTTNSLDGVASAGGGANEGNMPNDGYAYQGVRLKAKGGTPYAQGNYNVLVFGGGGGQGDSGSNDWLSLAAGGNGGGVVYVSAQTLQSPNIVARGAGGETACDYTGQTGDWGNSGGGGGAGGSIWVRANTINGGSLTATAGAGATICGHEGAAVSDSGGAGRIRIDATTWTGSSLPTANRGTAP